MIYTLAICTCQSSRMKIEYWLDAGHRGGGNIYDFF